MALSARNHLKGEITEVILGTVTALITVKVGDNVVESVITKRSAEEMGLKKGDKVTAVIKATEVMIQKRASVTFLDRRQRFRTILLVAARAPSYTRPTAFAQASHAVALHVTGEVPIISISASPILPRLNGRRSTSPTKKAFKLSIAGCRSQRFYGRQARRWAKR